MNTREEIIALLRSHSADLHSAYGVRKIGLFGSFAGGNPGSDSDVDIVVEFDRPVGLRFMDLADYLQTLLHKRVDLLTPAGIAGIRNKEIAGEIRRSIVYV
ncbi:MAG: nucleotidyltransferase family protein [Chitinispirillaceae bacterium]|nr:nucleotidyltransferase family protein [Chitinispirillaceae bacterium]